jgi:multidrug efflux system membrane fusion protein
MTTNTTPTDLKDYPEVHPRHGVPEPPPQKFEPSGKPKKRGFIWVLLLLIIAGVAAYAVWRAGQPGLIPQSQNKGGGRRGGGRNGGANGPIPVVTTPVKLADFPVIQDGLGNVTAYYTVTVKSRVDGQLMKVNFNEGDLVQQGQILIEIDPRPYQVQLELAQGQMARDAALLSNAKVDFDRYTTLLKQDAIPQQQLDTQKALVAQYEGNIKTDQANIDSANLNLIWAKVPAPITGRVGLRQVDPGNIVHASDQTGMVVITQLQPITALFTIPEDNLPIVMQKLNSGIKLPLDAYSRDNSQKLASGTLETVDNQIDPTTGTSKLKAVFPNKDNALFPQQFVNIKLRVDTLHQQMVVPFVAVQNGQQGTFVYVVDPDTSKVHLKVVKVGITDADNAEIVSGIKVGDQVVIDGTDRLDEGVQVRIRKPGELEAIAASGLRAGKGGKKGGKKGANGQGGQAQGRASDLSSEGPAVSDAARGNFGQKAGDSQYKGQFNKKGQFKKKGGGGEQ